MRHKSLITLSLVLTVILGIQPASADQHDGKGEGEFYTTDGRGGLRFLRKYTNWRRNWSSIVPGDFNSDRYTDLLFVRYYPAGSRPEIFGELYSTDGHGRIDYLGRSDSVGGQRIVPGHFDGDRFTDLLCYSSRSRYDRERDRWFGRGRFLVSDGRGNLSELSEKRNWRTSWTMILPGKFNDDDITDLLFYDRQQGHGYFYVCDGRGDIREINGYTNWRRGRDTGWSHIVPGNFNGDEYTDLFFYQKSVGEAEIYTTDGRSHIRMLRRHNDLPRFAEEIVAGRFNDDDLTDLLIYVDTPVVGDKGDGYFYVSDGRGGLTRIREYHNWRGQWTKIIPGNFNADQFTDLLFYEMSFAVHEEPEEPEEPVPAVREATETIFLTRRIVFSGPVPYTATFPSLGRIDGNLQAITLPDELGWRYGILALSFVKPGYTTDDCENDRAVVQLTPGETTSSSQMREIFGGASPRLPVSIVCCAAGERLVDRIPIQLTYTYRP